MYVVGDLLFVLIFVLGKGVCWWFECVVGEFEIVNVFIKRFEWSVSWSFVECVRFVKFIWVVW